MSFVISNVLSKSYERYTHPRLGDWDEPVAVERTCGINTAPLGHANAQSDLQGVLQRAPFPVQCGFSPCSLCDPDQGTASQDLPLTYSVSCWWVRGIWPSKGDFGL